LRPLPAEQLACWSVCSSSGGSAFGLCSSGEAAPGKL